MIQGFGKSTIEDNCQAQELSLYSQGLLAGRYQHQALQSCAGRTGNPLSGQGIQPQKAFALPEEFQAASASHWHISSSSCLKMSLYISS